MNKINIKLISIAIFVITIFFIFQMKEELIYILNFIKKIILPFFLAFFLANTLYPGVRYLKAKKINSKVASVIVLLIVFFLIFITIYYSLPLIISQIKELITFLINYINSFSSNFSKYNEFYGYILKSLEEFLLNLTSNLYINSLSIITSFFTFFSNLIIIIILTIYFLFHMEKIREFIKSKISSNKLYNLIMEIDIDINMYFKSLILTIFVEILFYTFCYGIIGHPNFLLLGFLAGITTFIPYIGAIVTNIMAIITAITVSKKLFFLTSITIIFIPIISSYFIDPKIYQKTISISPIILVMTIILSSSIFGFIGLLLAIPIYIVIRKIIEIYIL